MKFHFAQTLVLALATTATASTWFSKAVYNKWHETELERWLSDNNVPYPSPADRKDLENLVKANWESKVQTPIKQSADQTTDSYGHVKDWIFDSWTDSQLKAFLDRHSIPAPQPRKRDTLLKTARENYETVAKKLNQYYHYPGDWLYESWSESDLKEYLDERGWNVPQPTTRDKLIASVRRNSRLASLSLQNAASSASASAASAQASLADQLFDAWSDSQIKEYLDKKGVKVPQGTKRNELVALARRHSDALTSTLSDASATAASAFGAATTKAGNEYAKATDDASLMADDAFNKVTGTWSESRLKAFLDARGVPVPQNSKKDELLAKVRLNKHKASTGWSAWTFDTWTTDNLKAYLKSQGKKASGTRDQLVKSAQSEYATASSKGGSQYASVTNYLAQQTDAAKDTAFDSWTDSELKSYLDSYGVPVPQGGKVEELKAEARKQYNYFKYGTSSPSGTVVARIKEGAYWLLDQLKVGIGQGKAQGEDAANYAAAKAAESTAAAKSKIKAEL
ncbi:putative stress response protein [Phaeomoniella chlamydospora]|uniref:Putative stress response protein n=1 Tax=Phaeomoniella chlamydospora TaxID=158046 RepID=A0A0G2HJS7_PHACM|nr:putative stress response protein [Phaeomoniella chlamydospora]